MDKFTLLSSGNSLGAYVPAKILQTRLLERNVGADLHVLENLYLPAIRSKIPQYRKAYHNNFSVAKTGYRLAKDIRECLDEERVESLMRQWSGERRSRFLVFTGFWAPVLERYRKRENLTSRDITCIRLDAGDTPSFSVYRDECRSYDNVWLYSSLEQKPQRKIRIGREAPIPFAERLDRFVIHGGGWGIGTYRFKIEELTHSGLTLDVVSYYEEDVPVHQTPHRYWMINPSWSPWDRGPNGEYEYPPFQEVTKSVSYVSSERPCPSSFHDCIRIAKGIISKPGGATLLDSLASATPLIYLEPFGEHEQQNADLWSAFGFGISYEDWKQSHFSIEVLKRLHMNLLQAFEQTPDLCTELSSFCTTNRPHFKEE